MALLRVDRVSKRFGALVALHDISFDVKPREIFGIIGPNGAGKTTLINVISGVLEPTGGEVVFDGQRLTGLPPWEISTRGISRTFQLVRLFFELSVVDNLVLAQHLRRRPMPLAHLLRLRAVRQERRALLERAEELLAELHLSERRDHRVGDLSSAEQRRLQLAVARATEARLVLLDEPAAGLDRTEIADFRELVRRLRESTGQTFILIEHQVGLVMSLCHRIMVLNFGEKIAEGTPAEVRSNPDVVRAYLGQVKTGA